MSASPLESMPNSLSAEQAVLGGLMLDNCRWDEVADRIVADDFYTSAHREIFSEMERLLSHGKPIDLITLAEALEQNGKLERARWFCVPCGDVKEHAQRGKYLCLCGYRS